MGFVPTLLHEEFGKILICSDYCGLESRNLEAQITYQPKLAGQSFTSGLGPVYVRLIIGWQALALNVPLCTEEMRGCSLSYYKMLQTIDQSSIFTCFVANIMECIRQL